MHCTNVIHSLNVVIAERANLTTIHHSPCGKWKEISLEVLTLGGGGVVCSLMKKKCYTCKEVKPLDWFGKNKSKKDGRYYQCKDCRRQYYQANREVINERSKQYYEANKEQCKQYREANKEAFAERRKQRYQANKEAKAEYNKQYFKANKEAIAQYKKERHNTDPFVRLANNIRVSIRKALSNGGYSKKSKTHEILGCSFDEYHQHIEAQFTDGMSWERMSEIHIDHRLPLSAATTEAELLALNHHSNLQPLWKSDNLAKGSSYCPKELAAYFKKHLQ